MDDTATDAPALNHRFAPGSLAYGYRWGDYLGQIVAGRFAVRRLQGLAGAAFDAMERQEVLDRLPATGALALASAPNPRAFGAAHAGANPSEVAAARRVARVGRELPALHAAWIRQECSDPQFRRLAGIVTPATCDAWLAALRALPADEFEWKLAAAEPGQRPDEVTQRRARVAVQEVPTAAGPGLALDFTGVLPAEGAWVVHRAIDVAGRKGQCTPTVGRAFKVWLERCDRALREGLAPPPEWPKLEVHRCPFSDRTWFQTRWGNIEAGSHIVHELNLASDLEVHVLDPGGEYVSPTVEGLTQAYPFFLEPTPPRRPWGEPEVAAPSPSEPWSGIRWGEAAPLSPPLRRALERVGVPEPGAWPRGEPEIDETDPADPAEAPPWGRAPLGTVADRAQRALRWLAATRPEFTGLALTDLQAIAAAALRRCNTWRYRELELLRACYGLFDGAGFPAVEFLATLGISVRTYYDAVRLYHRLEEWMPRTRAAFVEGRVNYGKVRLIARRALPDTETDWLALALTVDEATLAAHVAATHRGDAAPAVPRNGAWPIAPERHRVRVRVELRLTPDERAQWERVTAAFAAAGRQTEPKARLAQLAKWYLVLERGQSRDRVIYQLAPAVRARAERRGLHPTASWPAGVAERLAACFPHLPWLADPQAPHHARALQRAEAECRRRRAVVQRHYEFLSFLGSVDIPDRRDVPDCIKDAVRWRDGERCVVPGCGNTLVLQHDHFFPVAKGGAACLRLDRRMCGPCNRARALGLLVALVDRWGEVFYVDRRRRRVGVRAPVLGQGWDEVLDAWAWDAGRAHVATAAVWAKFLREAIACEEWKRSPGDSRRPAAATLLERGHSPPSVLAPLAAARAG